MSVLAPVRGPVREPSVAAGTDRSRRGIPGGLVGSYLVPSRVE